MIKFETYIGQDNLWHWRLKAANGEIVCWGEAYSSLQGVREAVAWVRKYAPIALIAGI